MLISLVPVVMVSGLPQLHLCRYDACTLGLGDFFLLHRMNRKRREAPPLSIVAACLC